MLKWILNANCCDNFRFFICCWMSGLIDKISPNVSYSFIFQNYLFILAGAQNKSRHISGEKKWITNNFLSFDTFFDKLSTDGRICVHIKKCFANVLINKWIKLLHNSLWRSQFHKAAITFCWTQKTNIFFCCCLVFAREIDGHTLFFFSFLFISFYLWMKTVLSIHREKT